MDYTDFVVDRTQRMRPLEYDLSDNFNGLLRYMHDIGVLDNVPVGTLGPATVLSASDALAAPLRSLVVGGSSVQDGTPTPDVPVEIVSVVNPLLTVAPSLSLEQGTIVTLPVTLRGIPSGTRDSATYTYLRPSSREGWAWYGGEVTRNIDVYTFPEGFSSGMQTDLGNGWYRYTMYGRISNLASNAYGLCDRTLYAIGGGNAIEKVYVIGQAIVIQTQLATGDALREAFTGGHILYNCTPTTETLDPIELPVLPAPNVTIYATADATPTLTAQYVRDISAAINDMQEAIADI